MTPDLTKIFRAKETQGTPRASRLWQVHVPEHAHGSEHSALQSTSSTADFQQQMDIDMLKMMQDMHAPGYSGDPDVDFLTMMIPHHQGAVDMARLALLYGSDALSRTLAESIISNQVTEIYAMTARLVVLKKQRETGAVEFPPLSGTRGPGLL